MTIDTHFHIRLLALLFFLGLAFQNIQGQEVAPTSPIAEEAGSNKAYLSTSVLLGDVNDDGYVNVFDVTLTIDYILGKEVASFNTTAADTDDDGYINIYDVTMIIDYILKGTFVHSDDGPSLPTDDPEGGDPGTGL